MIEDGSPGSVPARHRVAVLAYPGMSGFELGMVTEVFGLPRPELDRRWYELVICATRSGPVPVLGGATFTAGHDLAAFATADTVVVPGVGDVHAAVPAELVTALRDAHARGARVVSICSGAFALAGAGLLDGRPATTHWRYAEEFRRRFPRVLLRPDVLYVDDGDVLTSAGSAAGLDLCLHLVRLDHGPTVANAVARRLVIPPHREGGQAQFVEAPVPVAPDDDRITVSMTWALAHLDRPLAVVDLARQAHLSERSYLRQFRRATGTTPIRWLLTQRVQASLPLLEAGTSTVEQVAAAVGFASPVTFRYHFAQLMRTSPSAYRSAFRNGR